MNLILFLMVTLFPTFSFAASLNDLPADQKSAFVVVSGASHINVVKSSKFGNQVSYDVDAAYPAKDIIDEVSKKLLTNGWIAQKEDFLNPGMPSAHVRGWTHLLSKQGNPTDQWLAQWKDKNGNFINYLFRYEETVTAPKSPLHILSIFINASAYEEMMKRIVLDVKTKR